MMPRNIFCLREWPIIDISWVFCYKFLDSEMISTTCGIVSCFGERVFIIRNTLDSLDIEILEVSSHERDHALELDLSLVDQEYARQCY